MSLHYSDWLIIAGYFFGLFWIGFIPGRNKKNNQNEFILSGRKLSLPGFIATLVTTWYGAILGIGENTYQYGIQTWFIFAFPYYVFAIIYAFWVANRVRQQKQLSIPDHFRRSYGKTTGIISAVLIVFLSSPAPYILSMGILLQFLFDIQLAWGLILATVFSVGYIWKGGFNAVVKTDYFQFMFMFVGFLILFIFSWKTAVSPFELFSALPTTHTQPLGGNTLQYVLVWFFIALWTMVDPGFFQRCAAAESPEVARKGLLISIGFWFFFDCLTIITGLYAYIIVVPDQPLMSFPVLGAEILPPVYLGLFLVGIFSIIMSTIDSFSLINAITLGRDILWRIKPPKTNRYPTPFIRKGLLIMALLSVILAFLIPSVVKLFYIFGSILIPGLILPFLFALQGKRMPEHLANIWILFPVLVSLIWELISFIDGILLWNIEPFYPGFLSSLILWALFYRKT